MLGLCLQKCSIFTDGKVRSDGQVAEAGNNSFHDKVVRVCNILGLQEQHGLCHNWMCCVNRVYTLRWRIVLVFSAVR